MRLNSWRTVCAAAFCLLGIQTALAQLVSFQLERRVWTTQVSTNPVGLRVEISASGTGIGLTEALFRSPKATNTLEGSTYQRSWSQVFPITNGVDAAETALGSAYPLGNCNLQIHTTTTQAVTGNLIQRDSTFAVAWTNGLSNARPQVTSILPPGALGSTQVISWVPPGGEAAYVSLFVLEGTIDTNLLATLASQGASALTNLAIVSSQPRLSSSLEGVTVTGLNPGLDHLLWLEFHQTSPESTTAVGSIESVRAHLAYHRRQAVPSIAVPPVPVQATMGGDASFAVVATGGALHYRWFHGGFEINGATNSVLSIVGVKESDAGDYHVEVRNELGLKESEPVLLTLASPSELRLSIGWDGPAGTSGVSLRLDIQGAPNTAYRIEHSTDLRTWVTDLTVQTDAAGSATYRVEPGPGVLCFRGIQSE